MKKYSDELVQAIGLASERLTRKLIKDDAVESLKDLRIILNLINKLSEGCGYEDPFATYLEKKKDDTSRTD